MPSGPLPHPARRAPGPADAAPVPPASRTLPTTASPRATPAPHSRRAPCPDARRQPHSTERKNAEAGRLDTVARGDAVRGQHWGASQAATPNATRPSGAGPHATLPHTCGHTAGRLGRRMDRRNLDQAVTTPHHPTAEFQQDVLSGRGRSPGAEAARSAPGTASGDPGPGQQQVAGLSEQSGGGGSPQGRSPHRHGLGRRRWAGPQPPAWSTGPGRPPGQRLPVVQESAPGQGCTRDSPPLTLARTPRKRWSRSQ